MDMNLEKECSALGGLFQSVVNDLKGSYPVWEDFCQKTAKLSVQLKTTIAAVNLFLDALQKIADLATNAKGSTRDIGTALTRICMRHRSIENRLKTLSSALIDCLVSPLQDKMEDWRQRAVNLDKEHSKDYKKTRTDIKKRYTDSIRLQKKVRKGESRMQPMLESVVQEVNDRYLVLLEAEQKMVRKALIEQRAQFCIFVSCFKPVLDLELGLLEEISHLGEVTDLLCKNSTEPYSLPPASENVIYDIKGLEHTWPQQFQTPPSSPGSSLGSRKSSFCSISSADSSMPLAFRQSRPVNQFAGVQGPFIRHNNNHPSSSPQFSSVISQDSGIAASQDVIYAPGTRKPLSRSDEEGGASTPGSLEQGQGGADSEQSTPSPSPSSATWPEGHPGSEQASPRHALQAKLGASPRPHTVSGAFERGYSKRPILPGAGFFVPPQQINGNVQTSRPMTLGLPQMGRPPHPPPVGRRSVASTPLQTPTPTFSRSVPISIPDFNAAQPDQIVPQPIYANVSELQTPREAPPTRRPRPSSFVGDDEDLQRLLDAAGITSRSSSRAEDDEDSKVIDDCVGEIDRCFAGLSGGQGSKPSQAVVALCTLPRYRKKEGRLIGRRRTLETVAESAPGTEGSQSGTLGRRNSVSKPPPPQRRNSQITAATPTAPSVDIIRSNSRCTTPIEENYSVVIQALNARLSQPPSPIPPPPPPANLVYSSYHQQRSYSFPQPPPPLLLVQRGTSEPPHRPQFDVIHETLLMQIRNGVHLRAPPFSSDRSEPKI